VADLQIPSDKSLIRLSPIIPRRFATGAFMKEIGFDGKRPKSPLLRLFERGKAKQSPPLYKGETEGI